MATAEKKAVWSLDVPRMIDRIEIRMRELDKDDRGRRRRLADKAGIDPTLLSKLLNGERKEPTAETIARLARALDTTTDYLLGIAPPPHLTIIQ